MAIHPDQHAEDYGLSRDVTADLEPEEGPPSQGQHGETRTRIPATADIRSHGAKTRRRIKQMINRGGGTP
jgi:hypothetical protein